jgi:hypothetical protein
MAIALLGIYLREMTPYTHSKPGETLYLFMTTPNRKRLKYPTTDK